MALRDIICTACSDVALSVDDSRSAEDLDGDEGFCWSCGYHGYTHVTEQDDGDGGTTIGVEFRPQEAM